MAIMLPNYPEFDSDQTIGTREEIDKWLFAIRLFGEFALLLQDGHLATGLGPGHTGIHDFEMPKRPKPVSYTHLRAHETVLSRMPSSA